MSEDKMMPLRKDAMPMDFSKMEKLVLLDLKTYPYQISQRLIGTYKKEDIKTYLQIPEIDNSQLQLRYISRYLYNASNRYKRTLNYFGNMLRFDYVLEPVGLDPTKVDKAKFQKSYYKTVDMIENMNLKHEFRKMMPYILREDIYYGYIWANKNDFFFQQLNPDYCKISSFEGGVYNVAFDFTYFFSYPNRLHMFPKEFQEQFMKYAGSAVDRNGKLIRGRRADGDGIRWRELNSMNTIVIKMNEDLPYCLPPLVGVFADLLDIEDFKQLKKAKTEIGNYKLLVQKIPLREGSENNNDYAITYDQAIVYHNNVAGVLPEQIGLTTTPMEIELIDFERDKVDNNKVAEAEQQYWNEAGVANTIFGTDAGGIGLPLSINADEIDMFALLRQFERWVNRFLKNTGSSTYRFRVKFLNTTVFNWEDVVTQYSTAAQFGMPVKSHMNAAMGNEPSSLYAMAFLENEVLELHENLIPLQSAHTMTDDEGGSGGKKTPAKPTGNQKANGAKGGAPQKSQKDLTKKGAQARASGSNQNRSTK